MNILVTGGTGYIGSHTAVELIEAGHKIVIVDNLINSSEDVVNKIETITSIRPLFYKIDCTDKISMTEVFNEHEFDGIMHFAGLKAVGESVDNPILYYTNNIISTIVLAELSQKFNVNRFVFSSSATVYGNQNPPFIEDMPLQTSTNPYGETKSICERILRDVTIANPDFKVSILRYFNPAGAHKSALIGERPNGRPNNLMPYVSKVAKGELDVLNVYGNDYETSDGTGVRDYIHVVDLAKGHVKAIERLNDNIEIFNLGMGRGISVLEIISTFEKINKVKIPYRFVNRRPGDVAISYADVSKANNLLEWTTEFDLEDIVKDQWSFENNIYSNK